MRDVVAVEDLGQLALAEGQGPRVALLSRGALPCAAILRVAERGRDTAVPVSDCEGGDVGGCGGSGFIGVDFFIWVK